MKPRTIEVAWQCRRDAEHFFKRIYGSDLAGACLVASTHLVLSLQALGRAAKLVVGEYGNIPARQQDHCWVEFRGKIVDITATQFSDDVGDVFIPEPAFVETHYHAWRIGQEAYKYFLSDQGIGFWGERLEEKRFLERYHGESPIHRYEEKKRSA
jgi:hypothetical protein